MGMSEQFAKNHKAIADLQAEIDRLKAENKELKAEIAPEPVARVIPQSSIKDYDEKVKLIAKAMKPEKVEGLSTGLISQGLLTPETKKTPVQNAVAVRANDYEGLLEKFPEQYRYKLRAYTGEELYYIYRICIFKPKLEKVKGVKHEVLRNSGDGLILGLKARIFLWLKGEVRTGVNVSILSRVGRKFKADFYEYIIESLTQDMIEDFGKSMNSQRLSG